MASDLSVEQLINELRDKAAAQESALSKLLGRAALALEVIASDDFSASTAKIEPRPTGLSRGWNLTRQCDGFVIGHSCEEPSQRHKDQALKDGRVYIPFLVQQGLDEQSTDASRLAFMLENHRKVVVELLPYGKQPRTAVYVEEGFMSDTRYPEFQFTGEWASDKAAQLRAKISAIDMAIKVVAEQSQQQEGA